MAKCSKATGTAVSRPTGRLPGRSRRIRAPHGRRTAGRLGGETAAAIAEIAAKAENIATRKASQNAIGAFAPLLPELIGGSADLAGSNLTLWKGSKGVTRVDGGNYLFYGVREFGMTAIANGLSLHGGLIPTPPPSSSSRTTRATRSAWRR